MADLMTERDMAAVQNSLNAATLLEWKGFAEHAGHVRDVVARLIEARGEIEAEKARHRTGRADVG